jgi:hypothetical protein
LGFRLLLTITMGLSYEPSIFDNIDELLAAGGEMTRLEYEDEAYRLRFARIKRLTPPVLAFFPWIRLALKKPPRLAVADRHSRDCR